jgi:hypothetical protein
VIYTLLVGRRRRGLNPLDYVKDLFTRLPAANQRSGKSANPEKAGVLANQHSPIKPLFGRI